MNKKQAKRIALEVVLCIIDMEIFNPTELPYSLLEEYGFDTDDYAKLLDELENIGAMIKSRMDKLDKVLDHTRKFDSWSFITKESNHVD